MNDQAVPTKKGQICKCINPLPEYSLNEYIVIGSPDTTNAAEKVMVVNIRELQRNAANPSNARKIAINKGELFVLADDLDAYIASWNNR